MTGMTSMKEAAFNCVKKGQSGCNFPNDNSSKKPYDLSGEASRRPGDDPATSISRELESDDVNEQTISSQVNTPDDDEWKMKNELYTATSNERATGSRMSGL